MSTLQPVFGRTLFVATHHGSSQALAGEAPKTNCMVFTRRSGAVCSDPTSASHHSKIRKATPISSMRVQAASDHYCTQRWRAPSGLNIEYSLTIHR